MGDLIHFKASYLELTLMLQFEDFGALVFVAGLESLDLNPFADANNAVQVKAGHH